VMLAVPYGGRSPVEYRLVIVRLVADEEPVSVASGLASAVKDYILPVQSL
jgi:hypothetical protein